MNPVTYLKGIDISHYQRFDNYQVLNQSQLAFVFIKATEGIYKDRDFATHSEQIAKTCLLRGAYHFLRFSTTAAAQAENYISTVRRASSALELPPVLDIEDIKEAKSIAECEELILQWLTLVEAEFGKRPIIYTGGWYWKDPIHLNNSTAFKDYPLWTSRYTKNSYLPMYGGWEAPKFWQFTDKGTIEGLQGNNAAIDLNYFLGDINELWEMAKMNAIVPSDTYNPKVEAVQLQLNKMQFNAGTADGKFGDFTLTAFHSWLQKNDLPREDKITAVHWKLLFGLAGAAPAIATQPPAVATATPKAGIVTANKLNIRAGAGVENSLVAQPLNKGQQVTILDEKNGWLKVKTEIEGWVTKTYLS